jgi:hypothetical protein
LNVQGFLERLPSFTGYLSVDAEDAIHRSCFGYESQLVCGSGLLDVPISIDRAERQLGAKEAISPREFSMRKSERQPSTSCSTFVTTAVTEVCGGERLPSRNTWGELVPVGIPEMYREAGEDAFLRPD